jgi:hypothetical protein
VKDEIRVVNMLCLPSFFSPENKKLVDTGGRVGRFKKSLRRQNVNNMKESGFGSFFHSRAFPISLFDLNKNHAVMIVFAFAANASQLMIRRSSGLISEVFFRFN